MLRDHACSAVARQPQDAPSPEVESHRPANKATVVHGSDGRGRVDPGLDKGVRSDEEGRVGLPSLLVAVRSMTGLAGRIDAVLDDESVRQFEKERPGVPTATPLIPGAVTRGI